jgi:hypothetical protein
MALRRPTARVHAIAAGLLWLSGCGFHVLDGLASGSDLVVGDASDGGVAPPAEGGRAPNDARADDPATSDAHSDAHPAPDTWIPMDATADVSSDDVASIDAEPPSIDGESLDASDGGDAVESTDAAPTPVKLTSPGTPVTDSGHTSFYVPTNTLDTLLSTRWASSGDGVWITYDLGTIRTLTSIRLAWFQGVSRVYTFDVKTSTDNVYWTTVIDHGTNWSSNDLQTYGLLGRVGRYVRVVGHRNTVDGYINITEAEIWGY